MGQRHSRISRSSKVTRSKSADWREADSKIGNKGLTHRSACRSQSAERYTDTISKYVFPRKRLKNCRTFYDPPPEGRQSSTTLSDSASSVRRSNKVKDTEVKAEGELECRMSGQSDLPRLSSRIASMSTDPYRAKTPRYYSRHSRHSVNRSPYDENINEAHNNYVSAPAPKPRSERSRESTTTTLRVPRHLSTAPSLSSQFVKVSRLRVGIDKRLTIVDEKSSAVLKYRTPHFRALGTVEVPPLQDGEAFQIGWIQVCNDMQFINVYDKEGLTSWEFPEIVSGKYKMISDADGKQYPWYGSKDEVRTVKGPTDMFTQVTVHMNDNFFPQVTWYIPHSDYVRTPKLTNIYRKQHFYAFLALRDLNTQKFRVLRAVSWSMELAIEVNPTLPLGRRAKLLGPFEQEQPKVLEDNASTSHLLESYAMNPPNANNAQVLVWRPRTGSPKVIVPPVQTTMDVNHYLSSTADYTQILNRLAGKIFGR